MTNDNWQSISAITAKISADAARKRADDECRAVEIAALDALSAAKLGDLTGAMTRIDDLRAYLIKVHEGLWQ